MKFEEIPQRFFDPEISVHGWYVHGALKSCVVFEWNDLEWRITKDADGDPILLHSDYWWDTWFRAAFFSKRADRTGLPPWSTLHEAFRLFESEASSRQRLASGEEWVRLLNVGDVP